MSARAYLPSQPVLQRGMVLVTSLLLLVVVTILALSMFRSYGVQQRIAGNVREKQRALQSAVTAEQYGEWWLSNGTNSTTGSVVCSSTAILNANLNQGQICTNPLATPWNLASWTGGVDYTPPTMNISTGGGAGNYYDNPRFYIADIGASTSSPAEIYKVTAFGYGGTQNTVAVVESTYSLSAGVKDLGVL